MIDGDSGHKVCDDSDDGYPGIGQSEEDETFISVKKNSLVAFAMRHLNIFL